MKRVVFNKTIFSVIIDAIVPILFTAAIIVMIIYGLSETEKSSRAEGLRILDEGIRRAVVTCYAIEGSYPESIAYIEENYGVNVDRTRYAVYYEIFASNIMPDITVIELE